MSTNKLRGAVKRDEDADLGSINLHLSHSLHQPWGSGFNEGLVMKRGQGKAGEKSTHLGLI